MKLLNLLLHLILVFLQHYIGIKSYIVNKNSNYPTLENSLFGAVKLLEIADIYKYKYSGYGIEFDRRGTFSFPTGGFGYNVIICGVDMSSSAHIDNKKYVYFNSWSKSYTRIR